MDADYGQSTNETDAEKVENKPITETSSGNDATLPSNSLKSTLAQCFATYVNSLAFMSLGLMYTISAVVIPEVKNARSGLSLNDEQVSWYAALLPVFQPVGCIIGGCLQNYIGRRQGLLLMNASTVAAWILLYKADSVEMLYGSSILMGISIGFVEAPSVTYVCEITTPKLRGTLVTYNNSNVVFGIMLTYLLATLMGWRTQALVCTGFSVLSVLLLYFIPDSPMWLINNGRTVEAIKSLQWLRGWVPATQVMPEFEQLNLSIQKSRSHGYSNSTGSIDRRNEGRMRSTQSRLKSTWESLLEKSTLRPFVFLCLYVLFTYAATIQPTRNFIIDIFNGLHLNMNSTWLTFFNSLASLVGSLTCAATVSTFGKRSLSLVSMFSSAVISVLLGLYIAMEHTLQMPSIFVALFILLGFTQTVGIGTIAWVILGEIYPIKTRSTATGITGAAYYIFLSVLVKTYYYLQQLLTTQGMFVLYGCIGIIGTAYLWNFMPETEGKTIVEIEELFEDDARKSCSHFRRKK